MLRSVLKNISEPSSKHVVDSSDSESENCTEELMRRNRRAACLPAYVREQLEQVKQVVANFVSTWSLPFGQKKQIEAELSKSITEALIEKHKQNSSISDMTEKQSALLNKYSFEEAIQRAVQIPIRQSGQLPSV